MKKSKIQSILFMILFVIFFALSGCTNSDDDSNRDDLSDNSTKASYTIIIDSKISEQKTTSNSTYRVMGQVIDLNQSDLPSKICWNLNNEQVSYSGEFPVDTAGNWNGQITLAPKENRISFFIPETTVQEAITVYYNIDYTFGGKLLMAPDITYVDDNQKILATIALTDPKTDANNVHLVLLEEDNSETIIANMTDDGNLNNGDEIESDNIYSCFFNINENTTKTLYYRVRVELKDQGEASSETYQMLVTNHIDEQSFNDLYEKQISYKEHLSEVPIEDIPSEIDTLIEDLRNDPDIEQVGKSDSGLGAWMISKDGIAYVIPSYEPGTKGGVSGQKQQYSFYKSYYQNNIKKIKRNLSSENEKTIQSNKALVIAAQYWDWGENDDIPKMKTVLENNSCYDTKYINYNTSGGGTVEDFKNMGDYGIILISSHGDSFYNGLLSLWEDRFGWNGVWGQVILHSNMKVTPENRILYEDDLKKGRLVLWYGDYGITPSFIKKYSGNFPNSFVYMSICRGAWNDTFAKAFLGKGAAVFLGYDEYVSVSFCESIGPQLLTNLFQKGSSLHEEFVSGQKDPIILASAKHPAEFKLIGSDQVSLETASFIDGGYESGNISQAWKTEGDARIITTLGSFSPTEGNKMAIISTGLGFTTDSGELSQMICLPSDACTISFDWNFFSEEFMEYVGSKYQDSFTATISERNDSSNSKILLNEYIDSLSEQVTNVENSFDEGDVYATGWKTVSNDIPESLKGKKVNIKFFATDVGDSDFDTAVLIDNIKILRCSE